MIAIYARVSSKQQDQRAQMNELRAWAKGQDEGVAVYSERESGTSMDRPEWQRLWSDLLAGKITKLVCWRIDRLGRTARGLLELRDELIERRIGFLSLREGLDLETASGRLMWGIVSSFAQYETEVRSERQRLGIARLRAEGRRYHKTRSGRQVGECIKTTPEVRTAIAEMRQSGRTVAEISRVTQLSRQTVYVVIDSEPSGAPA
jgi:DNA invertase Pin-like site-specific DNA recombinase